MSEARTWRTALALAAVAVAVQAPALRGTLIWDDFKLLHQTDLYTSASKWLESVTTPLGRETFYWRPVATTSFLIDTWIYGAAEWGHRLTAALLHGAATAAAFLLLHRLTRSTPVALVAALVVAGHPVHVETVTWISARFDLLAGLLGLGVLLVSPDGMRQTSRTWGLAAAGLTMLAVGSKESAFLLPALAVLWTAACAAPGSQFPWRAAAWPAAGAGAAVFVRLEAIGFLFGTRPASVAEAGGALEHLLLVGRATATSLLTLVVPWGTVGPMHRGERPIPPGDALGWAGIAAGLLLVAVTVRLIARRRPSGWLFAAFLLGLAPVAQIVPLDLAGGLHAADRFLYLPAFFLIAALASLAADALATRPDRARRFAVAAGALVLALTVGRLVLLPRWNDPVRFWRWAAEMAPDADVAQANLAQALLESGDVAAVEAPARRAGRPGLPYLVEALRQQQRAEEARRELDAALFAWPGDAEALVLRGWVLLDLGRAAEATEDFGAAIVLEAQGPARLEPLTPRASEGLARAREMLRPK